MKLSRYWNPTDPMAMKRKINIFYTFFRATLNNSMDQSLNMFFLLITAIYLTVVY